MAEKPVARVGDSGSHGGTIITASSAILVNNKLMARVGDIYDCPKHGPNPIVTGAPSIFGQGQLVAHVGSKTACGAVITSGSPDTFVDAPDNNSDEMVWDLLEEKTFVEFQLLNEREEPIPGENYIITLPDSSQVEGTLDKDGFVHLDEVPRGQCEIRFPDLNEYVEVD